MADRHGGAPPPSNHHHQGSSFLSRRHSHAQNSSQLLGLLTLIISGSILLILTGVTVTATVLSLIFFSPILLISSPIWVPAAAVFFIAATGFLSMCGFGVVVATALSWIYRYFRGFHPPGSDQFDYARSRMADTATHVKDYAREYRGYLHGKVKDAAPGA
ncbi:Oleosin like [Actinidia chinensis var. chinensis]|uniref:Oleosin like n=1 Tax=Actinidia chinensis var. chinensis TaxID=1590841 RepID=A0A2R6PU16_ACTCC|nr:Oleosin like [Actinidia chinensis var. chinensis]